MSYMYSELHSLGLSSLHSLQWASCLDQSTWWGSSSIFNPPQLPLTFLWPCFWGSTVGITSWSWHVSCNQEYLNPQTMSQSLNCFIWPGSMLGILCIMNPSSKCFISHPVYSLAAMHFAYITVVLIRTSVVHFFPQSPTTWGQYLFSTPLVISHTHYIFTIVYTDILQVLTVCYAWPPTAPPALHARRENSPPSTVFTVVIELTKDHHQLGCASDSCWLLASSCPLLYCCFQLKGQLQSHSW